MKDKSFFPFFVVVVILIGAAMGLFVQRSFSPANQYIVLEEDPAAQASP